MSNYIGNKIVLGGFVGNKLIVEECMYVNETTDYIRTSLIPYTFLWAGDTPESWGYTKHSAYFTIKSINNSTRTITFDFTISYIKTGYPTTDETPNQFTTGSFNQYGSTVFVVHTGPGYTENTSETKITNATATYNTTIWNSIYYSQTELVKKVIYQMVPYSWKSIGATTYDYTAYSFSEINEKFPPCEIYANKVCRTGDVSAQWFQISEEDFNWLYSEGGWSMIVRTSGSNPPSASYLPNPADHPLTLAVVHDEIDNVIFFRSITTGEYRYYRCLPD